MRPRKTWEKGLQELRLNAGAETGDGNGKKSGPKVEHRGDCTGSALLLNSMYLSSNLQTCLRIKFYMFLSDDIVKLTTTLSGDSMEVRTPVCSSESLVLCDLPTPIDVLGPIDYRSVCQTVKRPTYKEIPSLRRRSKIQRMPTHPLAARRGPPPPSGYSISGVASKNTREQNVVFSHAGSSPNGEEPRFADPLFSLPTRERETRRACLVFHLTSAGGPALQILSPPPVKVNLAVQGGITVPSRLPPAPPPRRRSHRPIERSRPLYEFAHDVSDPGTTVSITPEEGLIQPRVRTQKTDSNTRLGYIRSFL